MIREQFGQAVTGDDPKVLENISRPEINLAIWKDPLSAETKAYLAKVPLERFTEKITNDWYRTISSIKSTDKKIMKNMAQIVALLPDEPGRKACLRDIMKLSDRFGKTVKSSKYWMSLFIFLSTRPRWHADGSQKRGNITLVGDTGMIWRPNLRRSLSLDWGFHGYVRKSRDPIQVIRARDFAVFKCMDDEGKPLLHATPPVSLDPNPRLALVMGI